MHDYGGNSRCRASSFSAVASANEITIIGPRVVANQRRYELFWLVIEGDNGTGKDTLRRFFEDEGWFYVNGVPDALNQLRNARKIVGRDRLPAYLRYCQICAIAAAKSTNRRVIVRYWPSTLAGGYADELIGDAELSQMIEECRRDFPKPDAVIELRCDFDVRVHRIRQRLSDPSGHSDSLDPERGRRHRIALERIASCWNVPWLVIDTTYSSPENVFDVARAWIQEQEQRSNDPRIT
jgi:hypothetical protein